MTPPPALHSLAVALLALLLLPAAAPAAVADADVETRQGTRFGKVRFVAAAGERNRLRISHDGLGFRFRDSANPVRARGDCKQVDRHTAICPRSEDLAEVRLGDGDDRVVDRRGLLVVRGGPGDDVMVGSAGVLFLGDSGDDVLRGGRRADELTGGPGRDRLDGRSGDDRLFDGERDSQAARDVFIGGSSVDTSGADIGDTLSYGTRRRDLRIDIGRRRTSTEDEIRGFESLIGGSGDDVLAGDGDDNVLAGGAGDDVLRGGPGKDIPHGGRGDDRVDGGDGNDVVWGDGGEDRLAGGNGDDLVIALEERGPKRADRLRCGDGRDVARSDGNDSLTGACERVSAFSNGLTVRTVPEVDAGSAAFSLSCGGFTPEGCNGTLALTGPDGADLGRTRLAVARDTEARVVVPLTAEGTAALRAGAMVRVDLLPDRPSDFEEPGGYRVSLRAGP